MTCRTPWSVALLVVVSTAGVSRAQLAINEVDYDQPGSDAGEFVEIVNRGPLALNLSNISLVFINGGSGSEYRRVALSAGGSILSPGQYLVIAAPAVVTPPTARRIEIASADFVQNGAPDGLALIDEALGEVLDAFSYEGCITSAAITDIGNVSLVEGSCLDPATADDGATPGRSLARSPDGFDSDNAAVDWRAVDEATPGLPNPPPPAGCDPDVNQDGNADQSDIAYLVNIIGGGENPLDADPDFNRDGNADQSDVALLVGVIAGDACPF